MEKAAQATAPPPPEVFSDTVGLAGRLEGGQACLRDCPWAGEVGHLSWPSPRAGPALEEQDTAGPGVETGA